VFVHSDNIGSATTLTNPTSGAVQGETFYPWGVQWATGGGLQEQHFAAFHQRDPGTGLDYTLNRMYTSTQGRWLTPDPGGTKVVSLEDPQTWNMYSYVRDTPLASTDPLGLVNPGQDLQGHAPTDADNDPRNGKDSRQREQQLEAKERAAQKQNKRGTKPKPQPRPQPKPNTVAVGTLQPLRPAFTPQAPGLKQQKVEWRPELMNGDTIVGDLPQATITMQEKQTAGNDKLVVCAQACSDTGVLMDTQHVSAYGGWATIQQWFTVNGQSVTAMVIKEDGTVVAEGNIIQVTVTANGSTFTGVP
jgi:RHS repeat-associated protein